MSFWDEIIEFNDKYFPQWRTHREMIFFSNALAGEVGEICNSVKKLYGGGTNNNVPSKMQTVYECVDVLIYLVLFLEAMGIDEEGFMEFFGDKMKVNRERMERRLSLQTEA